MIDEMKVFFVNLKVVHFHFNIVNLGACSTTPQKIILRISLLSKVKDYLP